MKGGKGAVQRQVDQLDARRGGNFVELVAYKVAAHMSRPVQEILQKAELLNTRGISLMPLVSCPQLCPTIVAPSELAVTLCGLVVSPPL